MVTIIFIYNLVSEVLVTAGRRQQQAATVNGLVHGDKKCVCQDVAKGIFSEFHSSDLVGW